MKKKKKKKEVHTNSLLTNVTLFNETGIYKYRKQSFKLGTNGVGIVGSYESRAGESKLIYLIK